MKKQDKTTPNAHDVLEWDVVTWSRSLIFWVNFIKSNPTLHLQNGLELGAHHGGLTLHFARQFQAKMVCSDVANNFTAAQSLHKKYEVNHLITYAEINATSIPYPNATFDFVVFKSVLGVIGAKGQTDQIEQAMNEIHRVLKPGGVLFFAENLKGSLLHQLARRWFVPWGKNWHYLSISEMEVLLAPFGQFEIQTTGFFAAFIPKPEWLKNLVASIDPLMFFFPKNWRYVMYGFAIKKI